MVAYQRYDPIDYLVIGHIAHDINTAGISLGGTAAYAALTASAIGLRTGIVTFGNFHKYKSLFKDISITNGSTKQTTIFENTLTNSGRDQIIHKLAPRINSHMIPDTWISTPIVHLGPIVQEVDPNIANIFPKSFIGMTPQGWMRSWDKHGHIKPCVWQESRKYLQKADAAVISIEDIGGDEDQIEDLASSIDVLIVTEGKKGSRVYWRGDIRYIQPPEQQEVDPTGAGDIYACAFFVRYHKTKDPWEASRFATELASTSVTRTGIRGVPTTEEIDKASIEIIQT